MTARNNSDLAFLDIIAVVREIHGLVEKRPSVSDPLLVRQDILPCVHTIARSMGITTVLLKCLNWPDPEQRSQPGKGGTQFDGILLRRGPAAYIYYSNKLNRCWKRFVICKELCQMLVDERLKSYTTDIEQHVDGMVNWAVEANLPIATDRLCMYGALEMLLPWSRRDEIQAMKQAGQSHFDIADRFKIPERVVDRFFNPAYIDLSTKVNSVIKPSPAVEQM